MNRLSIPRAISVGCLIFIAVAACSQASEGGAPGSWETATRSRWTLAL